MSLDPIEIEHWLRSHPDGAVVISIADRRRAPDRAPELGDQAMSRQLVEVARSERRAKVIRIGRRVGFWALLALGLSVVAVFARAAWLSWWRS